MAPGLRVAGSSGGKGGEHGAGDECELHDWTERSEDAKQFRGAIKTDELGSRLHLQLYIYTERLPRPLFSSTMNLSKFKTLNFDSIWNVLAPCRLKRTRPSGVAVLTGVGAAPPNKRIAARRCHPRNLTWQITPANRRRARARPRRQHEQRVPSSFVPGPANGSLHGSFGIQARLRSTAGFPLQAQGSAPQLAIGLGH